jgi:hypothetical protein
VLEATRDAWPADSFGRALIPPPTEGGGAGHGGSAGSSRGQEGGSEPASGSASSEVRALVEYLEGLAGRDLVAVFFFGSRLLGTSPDSHSAFDLFVVVEDYRSFYRSFVARPDARRRHGAILLALLNRIWAPNLFVLRPPRWAGAAAKCCVISERDLERALSERPPDHFCRGRLTQRIAIVHTRGPAEEERLRRYLAIARQASLRWVPLVLEAPFTVEEYCRRMLEVSYSREVRPEAGARFHEVLLAQNDYLHETYGRILDEGVAEGLLERDGTRYRPARPGTRWEKLRCDLFFRRSQARATLRWLKYAITFDDWPDYIARKVERRTGLAVELTERERRYPVLFLWPKFFRFFRARRTDGFPLAEHTGDRGESEKETLR